MVWSDQDVEKAARHLIAVYGDQAEGRARGRATLLDESGPAELAAVWGRVADMIASLQDNPPGNG